MWTVRSPDRGGGVIRATRIRIHLELLGEDGGSRVVTIGMIDPRRLPDEVGRTAHDLACLLLGIPPGKDAHDSTMRREPCQRTSLGRRVR